MTTKPPAEAVHIIDDDHAIRDSLVWLLQSADIATVTHAAAEPFLALADDRLAGCAILDLRLGGLSGLDVLDALAARGSSLPVIMLTGHGDVPIAVQSLKKGAFDFMEKPFDPADLIAKVEAALAEGRRRRSEADELRLARDRLQSLSAREREVMDLMLDGLLNKQIADRLGIAMRTVEVHRARILEKFGLRSAVELAQIVTRLR